MLKLFTKHNNMVDFYCLTDILFRSFFFLQCSFRLKGSRARYTYGLNSGTTTGFWCATEAGGGGSESGVNILVAVSYFYLFVHSLFCLLQRVFVSTFVGRKCVIKERFSKKYRHPLLDSKLTLKRLNAVSFHN